MKAPFLLLVLAFLAACVFCQETAPPADAPNTPGLTCSTPGCNLASPMGKKIHQATADLSSITNTKTLYTNGDLSYKIYWQVTNDNLHVAFQLTAENTYLENGYVGFGFGKTMLDAQMIVCHFYDRKSPGIQIHQHISTQNYQPPPKFPSNWAITPTQGLFNATANQFTCEMNRPLNPDDGRNKAINVQDDNFIWSFSPNSPVNADGIHFSYHTVDHRGALKGSLAMGLLLDTSVRSYSEKQIHGFGMALTWLVLFPFSMLYARYFRSTTGWVFVHGLLQSIGVLSIFAFFIVILPHITSIDTPHAIIGFVLLGSIVLQLFIGVVNALGLSYYSLSKVKNYIRYIHRYFGFSIVALSVVQVYFGLTKLYPRVDVVYTGRGIEYWYIYFILIVFWVFSFICLEVFYRIYIVNAEKDNGNYKVAKGIEKENFIEENKNHQNALQNIVENKARKDMPNTGLPQYTWESLNKEITTKGRLYVVANRKYVYDVSSWINSHPGGKLILYSVAGTDISNDYFHEAGFDAEEFTPKPVRKRIDREYTAVPGRTPSLNNISLHSAPSFGGSVYSAPVLTETDWKMVIKARRPHVHTKLAIQKLASLLVGEILSISSNNNPSSQTTFTHNLTFDRMEYRRYAITERTLVSGFDTSTPVFRIKFCILFPFDIREDEPRKFLAGESVEIQHRIGNEWVSRYYTPINGDIHAFQIDVKIKVGGLFSGFLNRQRIGDRQFKIRGPFGSAIFDPSKPLQFGSKVWIPERVFLISAGSGFSPMLQILNGLLLPFFEPVMAINQWIPKNPDELAMEASDFIILKDHYYDGWGYGMNLRTSHEGVFPLQATIPRIGPYVKFTIINCCNSSEDVYGLETLNGVEIAYPNNIDIHHLLTNPRVLVDRNLGGGNTTIHDGVRLNQQILEKIITPTWDLNRPNSQVAVVSGPTLFNSMVVDSLMEIGAENGEIRVLDADRFIEY